MTSQEIYIERYGWNIRIFYDVCRRDADYICGSLVQMGCTGKAVKDAREHFLRGGENTGLTYSNMMAREHRGNRQGNILQGVGQHYCPRTISCRHAYMRDGRNRHDNGRALLYDGMALPIDNQLIYYHYEESYYHSRD